MRFQPLDGSNTSSAFNLRVPFPQQFSTSFLLIPFERSEKDIPFQANAAESPLGSKSAPDFSPSTLVVRTRDVNTADRNELVLPLPTLVFLSGTPRCESSFPFTLGLRTPVAPRHFFRLRPPLRHACHRVLFTRGAWHVPSEVALRSLAEGGSGGLDGHRQRGELLGKGLSQPGAVWCRAGWIRWEGRAERRDGEVGEVGEAENGRGWVKSQK